MKNQISLQELIAYNNTPKARALVIKYGYKPARNHNDLTAKLFDLTREYQEEALMELSKIHPHRDLILNYSESEDKKSNACGCSTHSSADGVCSCSECKNKKYSNFEMADDYLDFLGSKTDKKSSSVQKFNEYLPLIAVAGLFALAITAIANKG
jgi:hypothetical protein